MGRMLFKSPASRGYFRVRFSKFDVIWAALAPLLALYLRDAYILAPKLFPIVLLYCGLSLACTLIAFMVFRLSDGAWQHFSVHDALNVVKAAILAGLMTSLILFTFNRLDGIPRTTPVLQVLILAAGLLAARTMMLLFHDEAGDAQLADRSLVEHIIMIGSTRLSSLYIRFLRAYHPANYEIIAVLDHASKFIGGAIYGVPVVSLVRHLEPVIEEFAVHGVRADRIIIGGDENFLSAEELSDVRRICEQRNIAMDFVPDLVGLHNLQVPPNVAAPALVTPALVTPALVAPAAAPAVLPTYYRIKRLIDFFAALAAIIIFAPLLLTVMTLILFDMGSPVLFWQQRMGLAGRNFLLHKFRTSRPPFDRHGDPIPEHKRTSLLGALLRRSHIDELPQLFNVLVGDMSLIGPRPLLPHDQPTEARQRLSVRPGMTGWAQVNGGTLVTAEEKGALDEWYIHNMSLRLDLRIALMTLPSLFTAECRSEPAIAQAEAFRHGFEYSKRPPYGRFDIDEASVADRQAAAMRRTSTITKTVSPRF
jgi:lipopolysaccharide/colanic/teichoic acid biosynthesis glycosyltransferase